MILTWSAAPSTFHTNGGSLVFAQHFGEPPDMFRYWMKVAPSTYLAIHQKQPWLVRNVPLVTQHIWQWLTTRHLIAKFEPRVNFPRVPRIFRTIGWDTPSAPAGTWETFPIPIGSGDWDCPPAMARTAWEHGCCPLCGSLVVAYACGTCGAGLPNVTPCPDNYVPPVPPETLGTRIRLTNAPSSAIFPYTDLTLVELLTQATEATNYGQYDLFYLECGTEETLCVGVDMVECSLGGNVEWEFVEFMQPVSRAVLHALDYGNDPTQIAVIASGDRFDGRLFTVTAPIEGRLFGFRLTNIDPTSLDPGDDCQASTIVTSDCGMVGPPVEEPESELLGTVGFMTGFEEGTPTLTELGWEDNRSLVNVVRSGIDTTTSVHLPDNSSRIRIDTQTTAEADNPLYLRTYFKFVHDPSVGGEVEFVICGMNSTGGTGIYNVYLLVHANNVIGRYRLLAHIGGGAPAEQGARGTVDLTEDTWYRLEMEMIRAVNPAGQMTVRLYLGDTDTLVDTVVDNGDTSGGASSLSIGHTIETGAHDLHYWFDDIVVSHGGWIGPGTVHTLPLHSVRDAEWTPSVGVDNLATINEVPGSAVDTATYNETSTTDAEDRFRIDPVGISLDKKMNYSQVTFRGAWAGGGGGAQNGCGLEWDNLGVKYAGVTQGFSFATFQTFAGIRRWNDIPALQFYAFNVGYKCIDAGIATTLRVFNLWYNVNIH